MYPPGYGGSGLPPGGGGGGYPPGGGSGYGQPQQYPDQGRYQPPQPTQPSHHNSDYLPHLSQEYHSGYDIGQRDRQLGYPRDYRRSYERYGHGYESYFQEGYSDGYDGQRMRH